MLITVAQIGGACGHRGQNPERQGAGTAPAASAPAANAAATSTSASAQQLAAPTVGAARVVFRPPGQAETVVEAELARDWVRDPAIASHPYFGGRVPMETERGLMFRREMGPNNGMLFLFRRPRHMSFWMMNTYLPLDIIFITRELRVLGTAENATPQTTDAREVNGEAQYVLEVNAGFARAHNITPGTQVVFENVPELPNLERMPADDQE